MGVVFNLHIHGIPFCQFLFRLAHPVIAEKVHIVKPYDSQIRLLLFPVDKINFPQGDVNFYPSAVLPPEKFCPAGWQRLYFPAMKVRVAKSAGFCVGVKRAVELVLRLADEHRGRRIFTYGPLIHNPQTVKMLEEKGIMVFGEGGVTPQPGDIVVIRSHGVAPAVMEELSRKNYEIFDATCPKVAYVHRIAREYSRQGYAVIIVGDENHAEVIGIKGEVEGDGVAVVNSPEQVESLPEWEKVVVIAQTTMDVDTFNSVVAAVKQKFSEVVVKNTLCSETSYRQREIKELAADSDAFVVIGGKNSANTKRLFQLAKKTGLPTFW
ncbi:MAG TPA: 4-hydroxy-3-methylbut-2-enyl diphosphate reductase, partial [candidate division Zixibacteria bacterium]|nr:4-hydroxy-3-methylbut-2-enyl diphosphate reductase [candidate division Zixibacteria bacterium]